MLDLINKERARKGLEPLEFNEKLAEAAFKHSCWQAEHKKMSHDEGWTGPSFDKRIVNAGYQASSCAENIAWGYEDSEATYQQWYNSSGHYHNMMGPYKHAAIAVVDKYWTAVFASPMD